MSERPLPTRATGVDRTFWRAAAEGRLLIQSCQDCDQPQFFPRPWCHYCGSAAVTWVDAAGTGRIHAFTVVRRATELPWFADRVPYVVAYVDLDEGVRILTSVVNCEPGVVELEMPVQVTFESVAENVAIPQFEPR